MAYISDQKYIRNRDTGAVYPYREAIDGFPHLETLVADEDGNLVAMGATKPAAVETKLNPTRTPEKKEPVAATKTPIAAAKSPTMKPVDVE